MEAAHLVTKYLTTFGSFWNRTSQAGKEPEVLLPVIIEIFSMICPLTMGIGKISIAVFVDGEIVECGKDYSKSSYLNQILNGS